jgi:hypothetical protein
MLHEVSFFINFGTNVIAEYCRLNVGVEWLVFMLCIQEVPDSNPGLESDYHD